MNATTGVYNQNDRTMTLSGEVVYSDRGENSFVSSGALIDSRTDIVRGAEAVNGYGPLGSVRADSYEILDGGERFVLRGHVKGVLSQQRGRAP